MLDLTAERFSALKKEADDHFLWEKIKLGKIRSEASTPFVLFARSETEQVLYFSTKTPSLEPRFREFSGIEGFLILNLENQNPELLIRDHFETYLFLSKDFWEVDKTAYLQSTLNQKLVSNLVLNVKKADGVYTGYTVLSVDISNLITGKQAQFIRLYQIGNKLPQIGLAFPAMGVYLSNLVRPDFRTRSRARFTHNYTEVLFGRSEFSIRYWE